MPDPGPRRGSGSLDGGVHDRLAEFVIDEDTLVMFNADYGPETLHTVWFRKDHDHDAAGGLRGMKPDGREGGHPVPFIARWPGHVPARQASSQLTDSTDLFATVASVIGYERPDEVAADSFDMLPVLLGVQDAGTPVRPHMLTRSFRGEYQLRCGDWNDLAQTGSGGNESTRGAIAENALRELAPEATGQLNDLASDPGEARNLFFEEPGKRKELQTLLPVLTRGDGARSAPRNGRPLGIESRRSSAGLKTGRVDRARAVPLHSTCAALLPPTGSLERSTQEWSGFPRAALRSGDVRGEGVRLAPRLAARLGFIGRSFPPRAHLGQSTVIMSNQSFRQATARALSLALFLTGLSSGAAAAPPMQRSRAELFGQVLGEDGGPLAGAVVVTSAGGRALSGVDGTFRLELQLAAPAPTLRVTAVHGSGSQSQAGSRLLADVQPDVSTGVGTIAMQVGAGCDPSWLPTFGNSTLGFEGYVLEMAVYDDGNGPALFVAGDYFEQGASTRIERWNGVRWEQVPNAPDGFIGSLAVFDPGGGERLYVGGDFSTTDGILVHGIASWDGSSWAPLGGGVGLGGYVTAMTVWDDGSGGGPALYVGGGFDSAGGNPASNMARWDGSSWSPLGSGAGASVRALIGWDDGTGPDLYAAGTFTDAGGMPANRIAKWDGVTWQPLAAGLTASPGRFSVGSCLAVFDDGGGSGERLYVGGKFAMAGAAAGGGNRCLGRLELGRRRRRHQRRPSHVPGHRCRLEGLRRRSGSGPVRGRLFRVRRGRRGRELRALGRFDMDRAQRWREHVRQ